METKKIVTELTPELADKIWNDIQKKMYDERVSKKAVLHHLKQLKAHIGKLYNSYGGKYTMIDYRKALSDINIIIDKKIAKINGKAN